MRLILGDCLEVMATLPTASVDMVLCDLPYGEVNQKSSGLRQLDRGDADVCDIDLTAAVAHTHRLCKGSVYLFCGVMQISPITRLFRDFGMTTRLGVWEKTNPSPMNGEKLWLSGMEFCVFARKPKAVFNEHCKKPMWTSPSGKGKVHPTQKPVALMERLIQASSNPGETVLDFTMGSGTTGVACQNTGRDFIGVEREPKYYAIACGRMGVMP